MTNDYQRVTGRVGSGGEEPRLLGSRAAEAMIRDALVGERGRNLWTRPASWLRQALRR